MYKKLSQLIRFTIVAGLLVTIASFYTQSFGAAINPIPQSYNCTGSSTSGNDLYPTDEDNPISISDPGVLANDCTTDFPTNPTLDVSSINDTTTGVLTMPNASGSGGFDYDPNGQFESLAQGESTSDIFTYDVTDTITTVTNTVTITIDGVNDPPTDISLSATSIAENLSSGTTVGTFTTDDVDTNDTHTYTFASGTGDTDNGSFSIVGDALQSAEVFDFETKNSYSILVQTDDGNSGLFEKQFTITITDVNDPPTDISLSAASIVENLSADTTVGTFTTTDQDSADTHTYSLVAGTGDDDNSSFSIVDDALQSAEVFDFETKNSYSILVQTDDGNSGLFEKQFTITITDDNDPPNDISLSAASIAENLSAGTSVGNFTTTDQDTADTHSYSLVAGTGADDNGSFSIVGDSLQSAEVFDFETKNSYSILVQSDDGNSGLFEKQFTITITDTNDPPEVPNPIPDPDAAVGNLFTFTFAVDTFFDADEDTLTYAASKSDDTVLPDWLTFTPETRTFTGTPDVDDSGILSVKVTADDSNGGSVSDIFDIIVAGLIITPSTVLTTSEGGAQQAIYVELATQPTLIVVIGLNSNDTTEGTVSPTVLIFDDTNWDQQQLVLIDGVDDDIIDGDIPYNILTSITSSDLIYSQVILPDLPVTNKDDDDAGITIDPTIGLITSEDGTVAEFTIELDTEPKANVTVTFYSDDTSEGIVSPLTVTFTTTNWDIPKTITVTGVDDDIADDDQPYTIITNPADSLDANYLGFNPEDVLVTNSDPDTPGYTAAPLIGLVTTEGEDSAFVDIILKTKPQEQVTFSFDSSDTLEGVVNPQELTLDPSEWVLNEPITLQITGVDDDWVDGDKPYTITITAVSDDPDYDQVIIANVTNLDTPTIKWVKPVTTGVIFTIKNSTAVLLKCEKDGSEPIDKVAFYYWDKVEEKEIKIGEDNVSPYEIYFVPSPLHLGFNQVYCYAFGPTSPGDPLRISNLKHIWIERLPTEYKIHMPIINK